MSNYITTTISHESFNYAKDAKISKAAEVICDRITINENILQSAREEVAVIKAEVKAALASGVSVDEINLGLKLAGFTPQQISKAFLTYGIKRNAGKQNKGEKSKAVQALAEMLKEVAEENANTMEQAVAALRRAADQLRDEAKSKNSK